MKPFLWGHPFCTRKVAFQQGWPLVRDEINTFMFRFIVSHGLSRGVGLLLRWPFKRCSTVYIIKREDRLFDRSHLW